MSWDKKTPVRFTIYEADGKEYGQRWRFILKGDVREEMRRLNEETGRRVVARDYDTGKFLGEYPTKAGWATSKGGRKGTVGPCDRMLNVRVTEEIYRHAKGKGNVSAYVVGLILADMKKPRTDSGSEG